MSEPHAGLYLHIPFCARVCPYCDFAVRTGDRQRRRVFVDHLLREIDLHTGLALRFDTVYFGGGTPSCLEPLQLERILDRVRARLQLADDVAVFLEANPEDVTPASVAAWRRLGVHTLSLGVQALNAPALVFLGRLHDVEAGRRSVQLARQAGFETVSVDLIYGLPGQSEEEWQEEMDRALALQPDHLSCYQLTIHAGTRFGAREKRGMLQPLPTDAQADLFRRTHRHLDGAGMQGYEVSQFASSDRHRSRHNRKYWNHTPYLGLGPSAHSYQDGQRWWNLRRTSAWQERLEQGQSPVEGSETLDARALTLEALMTGLRTHGGVDLVAIRRRFGVDLAPGNAGRIARLVEEGLLTTEGTRLLPTLAGLAVADRLALELELPDQGQPNELTEPAPSASGRRGPNEPS